MRYLTVRKKVGAGGVAAAALATLTLLVVLPALAYNTGDFEPPASGYNITPVLVDNGGQNNDCSVFYPGSTVSADGTTVTLPTGQVLHQFYIDNPKNTTTASDPATGATFTVSVNTHTNVITQLTSTGAAILDIGINGGAKTTRYNYSGSVTQPSTYTGPYPGAVTGDTYLHPPISGTDKQGNPVFYTLSHTAFCYTTGATASGTVFNDVNHNGSFDNGIDSYLGATVDVYQGGTFVESTLSDPNTGVFQFTNLTPGTTYTACVVPPDASWVETLPTSSTSSEASCSGLGGAPRGYSFSTATTTSGLDFGLAQQATIAGHAYTDPNGNGTNMTAFPGLSVTLYNGDGTSSLATATTQSDGSYSFPNQYVGQAYTVCIANPGNSYVQTLPGTGPSCTIEGTTGYSIPSLAAPGPANDDFRFQPIGTLSGTVYTDVNGPSLAGPDGVFESGTDTPLQGWTVDLYDGSGTQIGQATTDENGQYSISAPYGTYTACVTPGTAGSYAQTEPLPTAANSCTGLSGLPKGQPVQLAAAAAANFGVDQSVAEPTNCPPQVPFGTDPPIYPTVGSLTIQLAGCKPNQTFVFDTGTLADGSMWASVFAADQVVTPTNPETPMIEKWVFPDPLSPNGTPMYTHVDYTDAFPYDPSAAVELPQCQVDPRTSDPGGMTLGTVGGHDFTQYANRIYVLPTDNPDGTAATSCAISTRIYVDGSGEYWLEVYAYSDIDSWGKSAG